MKFSINIWSFPKSVKVEEAIKKAGEIGYSGFELALSAEDLEVSLDELKSKFKKLKELCESYGLETPTFATGLYWRYNPLLDEQRKMADEVLKRQLEVARVLDARVILVVPGSALPQMGYEEMIEKAAKWLKENAKVAEDYGIIIGIENVWNKYLAGPLEFKILLEKVGHDFVKAYFDVGNTLPHSLPEHWIKTLGKLIAAVHAKDFSVAKLRFGIPLTGSVNWCGVFKALKEIGYDWYMTFEVPPYEGDPFKAAIDTKSSIDVILSRL